VNVHRLAATPAGMTAGFHTEVTSDEGRRVNFKVEGFDEKEKIAEGTHQGFVVNVARFAAKFQEKGSTYDPCLRSEAHQTLAR
jgi:fluoroacetyl-CoA thioesterase